MVYGDEVECSECGKTYSPTVHRTHLCGKKTVHNPTELEMELAVKECPGCTREGPVKGVKINPYFFVCETCVDDAARFLNNARDKQQKSQQTKT